ncbi:YqjF family protein [Jeotgalibacillus proteolyticus]|nr:DUF2071 domain-containing protein [Jeotgalibacillus proteolyticus]
MKSIEHRNSPLPKGPWLLTQRWEHLLFMHYPVLKERLQELVPKELEIDTFKGQAWITVIPFKVSDMRLRYLPPFPYLNTYLELNVRTYVKRKGRTGIYFFSLDADKMAAVLGARAGTLPYYYAKMKMQQDNGRFYFESIRKDVSGAALKGSYRRDSAPYFPKKDGLDFWLLERYYLWSYKKGQLFCLGIHHKRWEVSEVKAEISSHQLVPFLPGEELPKQPLMHYAESKRVLFWRLRKSP